MTAIALYADLPRMVVVLARFRWEFLPLILGLTLFNCPVYTGYGPMIAQHRYLPSLLRLPLGLKDMQLCLETARQAHVPVPLAHLVSDRLQAAINRGWEALDWSWPRR